jgi:CRISPR-associated protein Cst1
LEDLEAIASYMEENYVVDPLKSFLTVAFPNSGFTQPAYDKAPEKRKIYAKKVLWSFQADTPISSEKCIYTGKPAVGLSLDVKNELPPGRTYRQHIPLVTGEDVINFHPYGDAGLPVSGEALLAIQAFPLGCAKVGGRLLAVHSDDSSFAYRFAKHFLTENRKAILAAQQAGEKKLAEPPRRVATLLIETLLELERERNEVQKDEEHPVSVTAYHLSNSGQGIALDIYYLPLEITDFLRVAITPRYITSWEKLKARGWEIVEGKRSKKKDGVEEVQQPRFNVLYEDLFRLPDEASQFIRRYFLRRPVRNKIPGDPRAGYSLLNEANLVSWDLTQLFLEKVVSMDKNRIEQIRKLGDVLAEYVNNENDRKFFHSFLTVKRYDNLRASLIRLNVARMKNYQDPVVSFDQYIEIFEQGEELPYSDWRLARDLVLIRMVERLHGLGWIEANKESLPDTEVFNEE